MVGKVDTQLITAVRTTAKVPFLENLPRTRLADFLAALRYLRVGMVAATITIFGMNSEITVAIGLSVFQVGSLKLVSQL
jgi:hypothetical protein